MDTYTTGQTAGMTGIPVKTMQRYIKTYPEAFTETARKPDRGRRYTAQDIKHLLLIRHLHQERTGPERIRQALSGEWAPEAGPWYDIQDALTLAKSARVEAAKSGKYLEQIKWIDDHIDSRNAWTETELKRLRQDMKQVNMKLREIEGKLLFMQR